MNPILLTVSVVGGVLVLTGLLVVGLVVVAIRAVANTCVKEEEWKQ